MTILAFETSCDETSVALVRDGRVLSNLVSSQVRVHLEYGGVVPELAVREHLRNLIPLARACFQEAGVGVDGVDAVAATQGPGLPGALLVGLRAAQSFAIARSKPFVPIHHHEAHLYSPWIRGTPPREEFDQFTANVSLIVSGGHTLLVSVRSEHDHEVLGSTVDDAAGECFDKVAKLIGLSYPGGPEVDRLAREGNALAFRFPRPLINDPGDDFSFSGLKTSVRYFLDSRPEVLDEGRALRDLCASVQAAIVDVLVAKTTRAARRLGVRCVTASGGVTCNSGLRTRLVAACAQEGMDLRLAAPGFCTDNAAMVAILAGRKLDRGKGLVEGDAEIRPGWSLDAVKW